ncbi:MAG: DUF6057 family protein [Bacteroidaceae bacterium]
MYKAHHYTIQAVLFWLLLSVIYFIVYAETLRWQEGNSIFLYSSEMLGQLFSNAPGGTNILSNFLLQFFQSSILGSLILSGVLTLCSFPAWLIAKKFQTRWVGLCFFPTMFFATVYPLSISPALSSLFFLSLIAIYLYINSRITRGIFAITSCIVGYILLPFVVLLILSLIYAMIELFFYKVKRNILYSIFSLVIIGFEPSIASNLFAFIPYDERYMLSVDGKEPIWTFITYLLPLIILFLSHKLQIKYKDIYSYGITLLLLSIPVYSLSTNENAKSYEESYKYARMAENGKWDELLNEFSDEDYSSQLKLSYALLAESALGTLPEHLFRYPITSENSFLFQHVYEPYFCNFNRLFYKNINVSDEAFHQAFEYGTMSPNGICFKSLRYMIDDALTAKDIPLAQKYIYMLSRSSCHDVWLNSRREQLDLIKQQKQEPLPLRSTSFIGLYKFGSEMIRLLQEDPTNIRKLDYLLCGLLLNKELDKFEIIIKSFPIYKGKTLPKAYAEVAAMLKASGKDLGIDFSYSKQYDNDFSEFYHLYEKGEIQNISKFQGTYWAYYMYATINEEQQAN